MTDKFPLIDAGCFAGVVSQKTRDPKIMRINYFDYFRAIAILFVVAGHSYYPWHINSLPEMVIANLITGGTALFVFISGFFFHRIFYPKFQFWSFLIKKSKNVLLPYIVLSSVGFLFIVVICDTPNPHIVGDVNGFNNIFLYLKYLWTGQIITAYWYIPFIMIIFAISPLFIKYIDLSLIKQIYIFILLLVVSMLIHRPAHNLSPIHSVIYFTPLYMLGIIFSNNEKSICNFIKNKSFILGIVTLLISVIQVAENDSYGNYQKKEMLSYAGVDIIIIQKIFMIFFFLSILQKIDKKEIKFLKYIASISFAIYLLHPWVLKYFSYLSITDYISFLPGIILFPIKTILIIGICLAVATLFKTILGKRSRYIIGY